MFNSNRRPQEAPFRSSARYKPQNLGDLEFDLSMSLKVKSNGAVGLPIYDFLLASNCNYVCNSHHLGVAATRKFFSYLLSFGPNFDLPPNPPLPLVNCFPNGFLPGSQESLPPKMKFISSIFFEIFVNGHTDPQTNAK